MNYDSASNIQDLLQFGEFGDVNPSITDSATYTFMQAKTMSETFDGTEKGCYLYSRHWNPSNRYLADAMASLSTILFFLNSSINSTSRSPFTLDSIVLSRS